MAAPPRDCRAISPRLAKVATRHERFSSAPIIADAEIEIELRRDLTDDDVIEVQRRGIKKRRESIDMHDKGGRVDLADKERMEGGACGVPAGRGQRG